MTFDNYAIDTKLLNNNIISLKYSSTGNPHPKFKETMITDKCKEFVKNLIQNKKPNTEMFNNLSNQEKHLMSRLCQYLNLDETLNYDHNDFNKQFKLLYGEYQAGNDSPLIKKQLKKYILQAIKDGLIPKATAYNMIMELSV